MSKSLIRKYSAKPQKGGQGGKKPARTRLLPWQIALIVLGALVLLGGIVTGIVLLANRNSVRPIKGTDEELASVGKIEEWDVCYEELRFVTLLYKEDMEAQGGAGIWEDPEARAELERLVMNNITANYAVLSLCKEVLIELGSPTIEQVVQENVAELVAQNCGGSMDVYRKWLAENNLTDHYLRFIYEVDQMERELYYSYSQDLQLFECDTEADFLAYALDGNMARTIHVLIRQDAGDDPEENLEKAKKAMEELRAGASFSSVISRYSEDYQMVTDEGYYFTRGEMEKAYEDATFALGIADCSDIIEIDGDYYIIKRLEPDRSYILNNLKELFTYYQYACLNELISERQQLLHLDLNEYGKTIKLWEID